jgi:hypothetical protein
MDNLLVLIFRTQFYGILSYLGSDTPFTFLCSGGFSLCSGGPIESTMFDNKPGIVIGQDLICQSNEGEIYQRDS